MTTVSHESMVLSAQAIHSVLTERSFDLDKARKLAKALYKNGNQIVSGYVQNQTFAEIVSPVLILLDRSTSLETVQHQMPLLRALIKAERLFTELTWYQLWNQGEIPIYSENRDKVLETAKKLLPIMKNIPLTFIKGRVISSTGICYQLRCMEQAAKWLGPTKDVWERFCSMLTTMNPISMGDMFKALTLLLQTANKEWMAPWYLQMWHLNWVSVQVADVQGFTELFLPQLKEVDPWERGGKYAVGTVMALMNIIKNPKASDELKELVFEGNEQLKGLKNCIDIDRSDDVTDLLKHPGSLWNKIARKSDRFSKTRELAMHYLTALATKEKHRRFRERSTEVLNDRWKVIKNNAKQSHATEKERLQERISHLEKLEKDEQSRQRFLEELEVLVANLSTSSRGSLDQPGRLDEALVKIEELENIPAAKEKLLKEMILQDELLEIKQIEESCLGQFLQESLLPE